MPRTGVNWLLGKLQDRQNVILGDEMGLGKTIQVRDRVLLDIQKSHAICCYFH